jgi:hypothetical protein
VIESWCYRKGARRPARRAACGERWAQLPHAGCLPGAPVVLPAPRPWRQLWLSAGSACCPYRRQVQRHHGGGYRHIPGGPHGLRAGGGGRRLHRAPRPGPQRHREWVARRACGSPCRRLSPCWALATPAAGPAGGARPACATSWQAGEACGGPGGCWQAPPRPRALPRRLPRRSCGALACRARPAAGYIWRNSLDFEPLTSWVPALPGLLLPRAALTGGPSWARCLRPRSLRLPCAAAVPWLRYERAAPGLRCPLPPPDPLPLTRPDPLSPLGPCPLSQTATAASTTTRRWWLR